MIALIAFSLIDQWIHWLISQLFFLGRTLQFYDETCCTKTFVFCHFLFSFESQFQFFSLMSEIHFRRPWQLLFHHLPFLAFILCLLENGNICFCLCSWWRLMDEWLQKKVIKWFFLFSFLFIISFGFLSFFLSAKALFFFEASLKRLQLYCQEQCHSLIIPYLEGGHCTNGIERPK